MNKLTETIADRNAVRDHLTAHPDSTLAEITAATGLDHHWTQQIIGQGIYDGDITGYAEGTTPRYSATH